MEILILSQIYDGNYGWMERQTEACLHIILCPFPSSWRGKIIFNRYQLYLNMTTLVTHKFHLVHISDANVSTCDANACIHITCTSMPMWAYACIMDTKDTQIMHATAHMIHAKCAHMQCHINTHISMLGYAKACIKGKLMCPVLHVTKQHLSKSAWKYLERFWWRETSYHTWINAIHTIYIYVQVYHIPSIQWIHIQWPILCP